jgi:hypothetical protein
MSVEPESAGGLDLFGSRHQRCDAFAEIDCFKVRGEHHGRRNVVYGFLSGCRVAATCVCWSAVTRTAAVQRS